MIGSSVPFECHSVLPKSSQVRSSINIRTKLPIPSRSPYPNQLRSATMFIMNIFQRAYLTFAFLALFITLHPDQVEAVEIVKKECTYHFNRVGAVPGRASCQYNDFVDFACEPTSCLTKQPRGFESLYYYGCHASDFSADRKLVHAAQYVRRDTYASVQDWDGSWWDCPYNIPGHHNDQYLGKSRLSRNQSKIHELTLVPFRNPPVCTDCYYVPPKP
ncbi:hypothetical protein PSHT_02156 [Puccinia striiformis]|uniref:Uncharacterized protein n=1 Tax=Puccinia striiformis TaxID=27350 RepID=A0A2S4WJ07_9BASI|nr:hypothetical protein PSHT_02156 [Puccinia striiformis]